MIWMLSLLNPLDTSHPLAFNRSSHLPGDDLGPGSLPKSLVSLDIPGTNCVDLSSPESTAWNKELLEVVTASTAGVHCLRCNSLRSSLTYS